jgi:hypothetical protein
MPRVSSPDVGFAIDPPLRDPPWLLACAPTRCPSHSSASAPSRLPDVWCEECKEEGEYGCSQRTEQDEDN